MKNTFKKWLSIFDKRILDSDSISACPKCKSNKIISKFFADKHKRGFCFIWCDQCNHGIQLSRIAVKDKTSYEPIEKAKEITIPSYIRINPL